MALEIHLATSRVQKDLVSNEDSKHIVTPGEVITADSGFMRGHGTYMEDNKLYASVAGCVERVNKLICVKPVKSRYNGEVGDVVIGRILQVGQRRWKVDIHSRQDAILMLSAVNLPGGELRRRSEEDERMMRGYLAEGDIISAEVQAIFSDGALSLHTRSLKYGKLSQGTLVQVAPSLVKRRKTHFHNLPCGASIILGNNGYVWICPTVNDDTDNTGGFIENIEPVSLADREVVARLHNCVIALAQHRMMLYDTSVLYTFEASLKYQVRELLKPAVMKEVVGLTQQRLELES